VNALRSLLVPVDADPRCAARLLIARRLAERFGSRVTALFAANPPLLDMPLAHAAGGVAGTELEEIHAARRERARASVDEGLADLGERVHWAEASDLRLVAAVAEQASLADLLVLGQDGESNLDRGVPEGFAEAVLRASGRPGLLVPHTGHVGQLGRVALVAWRPTPEAARALSAALPLLAQAEQVHVVSWGPHAVAPFRGSPLGIETRLQLHGIRAQMHRSADEPRQVGTALLGLALDLRADLLVMGCYGHSRAREFVLGGASRSVLKSMPVPVLMSH